MKRAIDRHERGEAQVIPIILRHVMWQIEPLGKLQALPRDAIPVVSPHWHSQDEAFLDVVDGILKVIEKSTFHEVLPKLTTQTDPPIFTRIDVTSQIENIDISSSMQFKGRGPQVTHKFALQQGLYVFKVEHTGKNLLRLRLLDEKGQIVSFSNMSGYFHKKENQVHEIVRSGMYLLHIVADDAWIITIESR